VVRRQNEKDLDLFLATQAEVDAMLVNASSLLDSPHIMRSRFDKPSLKNLHDSRVPFVSKVNTEGVFSFSHEKIELLSAEEAAHFALINYLSTEYVSSVFVDKVDFLPSNVINRMNYLPPIYTHFYEYISLHYLGESISRWQKSIMEETLYLTVKDETSVVSDKNMWKKRKLSQILTTPVSPVLAFSNHLLSMPSAASSGWFDEHVSMSEKRIFEKSHRIPDFLLSAGFFFVCMNFIRM
jgi:hypothetical protein